MRTLKTIVLIGAVGLAVLSCKKDQKDQSGNAPETAAQMMHKALAQGWDWVQLDQELKAYAERQKA